MAEKRRPSTNPSGALRLHPRMWGRVFEYVDDSLDDLARVKAAGCVLVCCKDLKRILAAGGAELWLPLIESVVAVAPCVGRSYTSPEKPWLPLAALSTTCVHCRTQIVPSCDPYYGSRLCDTCCGDHFLFVARSLITGSDAQKKYFVMDQDLRTLPHRTSNGGYGPCRYYVRRHVIVASARRFGARRTFDMAKIIRSLRKYGGSYATRIAEEYLESSPEYCQELLDALVRGKLLRKETGYASALGKTGYEEGMNAMLADSEARRKALGDAKKALDEGKMSEEDFETTKARLLEPAIYDVATSSVPHEAHLVCDMHVGQVTRRPSSKKR